MKHKGKEVKTKDTKYDFSVFDNYTCDGQLQFILKDDGSFDIKEVENKTSCENIDYRL